MPETISEETLSNEIKQLLSSFKKSSTNESTDGWGPNKPPEQFKDLPYQKFSKSDKIGKIADWTLTGGQPGVGMMGGPSGGGGVGPMDKKNYKYQPQFSVGNVGGQYSYFHEEDESQFTLVDQSKQFRTSYQKKISQLQRTNKSRQQQYQNYGQDSFSGQKFTKQTKIQQDRRKQQRFYGGRSDSNRMNRMMREPSIRVKEDWKVIEEIDFPRLTKLSLPMYQEPVDVKICGSLEYYDRTYDRINTKLPKKLNRINRVYHKVTTTDDPVIRSLSKSDYNVFATDSIISTLMCCCRSVYPWDIVVSKIGNKLFFDKRDESNFDLLTVNETSMDVLFDDDKNINSPNNLALEATFINHNFAQQALKMNEERYEFDNKNPFIGEGDEGEVASVAYRYRKWDLGNGINLIIRSEIDAVTTGANNELQYLSIKALNEWDSRVSSGMDWRSKLDSQPGAVLAYEIKANGCKLAKWTVCALLSDVDNIKFGFVSRANSRATDQHVILGTQQFKPNDFANQIALNMDNSWGIVRCIIDFLMKQENGKYIIMKDPNKAIIRIYDIPNNTFSDEDDDDDDNDGEEDGNETTRKN